MSIDLETQLAAGMREHVSDLAVDAVPSSGGRPAGTTAARP